MRRLLAALLNCGCTHAPAPVEGPEVGAMNAVFRGVYARARARETRDGQQIAVEASRVTLYAGDRATESVVTDDRVFHTLKAFAHVPITAYVLTRPESAGLVKREEVEQFLAKIGAAEATLAGSGLTPEQQTRARGLAAASLDLVRRSLDGAVDRAGRLAFARAAAPAMLASADDAVRRQIDVIHAAVQRWRGQLSPAAWSRLRVLVFGVHQARRLSVGTQYFAGLLGECGVKLGYPGEGGRVNFVEVSPLATADRLQLTGLVELDADVGAAFFADPTRLATDLLADGARRRISELGGFIALPCSQADAG